MTALFSDNELKAHVRRAVDALEANGKYDEALAVKQLAMQAWLASQAIETVKTMVRKQSK